MEKPRIISRKFLVYKEVKEGEKELIQKLINKLEDNTSKIIFKKILDMI